jgi:hypothetical protein
MEILRRGRSASAGKRSTSIPAMRLPVLAERGPVERGDVRASERYFVRNLYSELALEVEGDSAANSARTTLGFQANQCLDHHDNELWVVVPWS